MTPPGPRIVTRWSWIYMALLIMFVFVGVGTAIGTGILFFFVPHRDLDSIETLDECVSAAHSARNAGNGALLCVIITAVMLFATQWAWRRMDAAIAAEADEPRSVLAHSDTAPHEP